MKVIVFGLLVNLLFSVNDSCIFLKFDYLKVKGFGPKGKKNAK